MENPSNSPLLALCKTPVTNFSEKALEAVVSRAGGSKLDWKNLRDADGMSPLGLAALSNNHFMVAHLLDKEGVGIDDRMSPMGPGDGMTPLMLAAKGASLNCLKVILNRRPKLLEKDGKGRTALAHCLDADSVDSLVAATMLLQSGIPPEDCVDEAGEGFLHRAVRYG